MDAYPFYMMAVIFDQMQGAQGGMIRAIGYQNTATLSQLFSIWLIMIPAAYIFSFTFGYEYTGLWMGAPFGNFVLMICYTCISLFAPLVSRLGDSEHQEVYEIEKRMQV